MSNLAEEELSVEACDRALQVLRTIVRNTPNTRGIMKNSGVELHDLQVFIAKARKVVELDEKNREIEKREEQMRVHDLETKLSVYERIYPSVEGDNHVPRRNCVRRK